MDTPGDPSNGYCSPPPSPRSDTWGRLRLVHPASPREGACGAAEATDDGRYAAVGCCAANSPCAAEALQLALETARLALGDTLEHDAVGRRIHALSESLRERRNDLPRARDRRASAFRTSLLALRVLSEDNQAWCLACGDVTIHLFDKAGSPVAVDPRLAERQRLPLPEGYPHSAWCRLELPCPGHVVLVSGPLERRFPSPGDLLRRLEEGDAALAPDDACVWLSVGGEGG